MSLKGLFQLGRRLLKGKKESATPTTGQQQKLLTYEGKTAQETGLELAKKEISNPPVKLNKTKPLYMGDNVAPAFGSSTYDWAMRIGPGRYTADEWLNHLTSTRKVNFKVFGKPSTRTVRDQKRFKYDSGPFAGREANVTKEELFDSNIATFDEAGNLTGGLLAAAKKFGIKLDANEVGNMIKLNPINRLKPVELGVPSESYANFAKVAKNASQQLDDISDKYANSPGVKQALEDAAYALRGLEADALSESANKVILREFTANISKAKGFTRELGASDFKKLNKILGEVDGANAKIVGRNVKTQYGNESQYTFQGGKDYRETIFRLDEAIPTNSSPLRSPSHFSDAGTNQIYHVRFDTRFTPDGKKGFFIHEIQSDVNQNIAKQLTKSQQLSTEFRNNPFQRDIELGLLMNQRQRLTGLLDEAVRSNDSNLANTVTNQLAKTTTEIQKIAGKTRQFDYFPMVEADQYGDHALKYLMNKAAKMNYDFVAVAPFDKLSFRQGYKAGNERFYGYASGKGINRKGTSVMANVMKKAARFYDSKAGPIKVSLSDPAKPFKKIETNTFTYPSTHTTLGGKKLKSIYHSEARKTQEPGLKFIEASNPNLYFDAFAVKVNPLMKYTQKTYKRFGGLVVDMFKPIGYN